MKGQPELRAAPGSRSELRSTSPRGAHDPESTDDPQSKLVARGLQLITADRTLKVFSVLASLGLFALTHGSEGTLRTVNVSLTSRMPAEPSGRELRKALPAEVSVTLRGPRVLVADLRPGDFNDLQLDLRRAVDAEIELLPSMLPTPRGVTIERFTPSKIEVVWDELGEREIPVQVTLAGSAPAGLAVVAQRAEPMKIAVRGPKRMLELLQLTRTAPIELGALKEGVYEQPVLLERPLERCSYTTGTVTAFVELRREQLTRHFSRLRVQVVGTARGLPTPSMVDVDVTGVPEAVAALRAESILPIIEPARTAAEAARGSTELVPVKVELPGLSVKVTPPQVLIR